MGRWHVKNHATSVFLKAQNSAILKNLGNDWSKPKIMMLFAKNQFIQNTIQVILNQINNV